MWCSDARLMYSVEAKQEEEGNPAVTPKTLLNAAQPQVGPLRVNCAYLGFVQTFFDFVRASDS